MDLADPADRDRDGQAVRADYQLDRANYQSDRKDYQADRADAQLAPENPAAKAVVADAIVCVYFPVKEIKTTVE